MSEHLSGSCFSCRYQVGHHWSYWRKKTKQLSVSLKTQLKHERTVLLSQKVMSPSTNRPLHSPRSPHNIWSWKAALSLKLQITHVILFTVITRLFHCRPKLPRKSDKHRKEGKRPNENQCTTTDQPMPSFTLLSRWIIEHSTRAELANGRDTTEEVIVPAGSYLSVSSGLTLSAVFQPACTAPLPG